MGHRKFWPEDTDPHGRWGEYRDARVAERGTRSRRDLDPMDRGLRAEIPGGGYQRPRAEGWRAYDPGDLPRAGMTGQRGLGEGAADEVAAPSDEDRVLERVDQDHRGRGPKAWRRSDQRIAEDVNDRLTDDPDVDATDVEVRVENGEVTLSGTVDSRLARRRAEDLAEDVRGVGHVQNNLRVHPTPRRPRAAAPRAWPRGPARPPAATPCSARRRPKADATPRRLWTGRLFRGLPFVRPARQPASTVHP